MLSLEDFMGRGGWKTEERKFVQFVGENTGTRVRNIEKH